jgi:hypothetical protein
VRPGSTFTADANGQSFPVQLNADHTATFPTLPNSCTVIHVPEHTDFKMKECNAIIDISGITGQMDLTGSNIFATQIHLLGKSHLHVDNGSIAFDGSFEGYDDSLFDGDNAYIGVRTSNLYRLDAKTGVGNINVNPASFCNTPPSASSECHHRTPGGHGPGLTLHLNSGSMGITLM